MNGFLPIEEIKDSYPHPIPLHPDDMDAHLSEVPAPPPPEPPAQDSLKRPRLLGSPVQWKPLTQRLWSATGCRMQVSSTAGRDKSPSEKFMPLAKVPTLRLETIIACFALAVSTSFDSHAGASLEGVAASEKEAPEILLVEIVAVENTVSESGHIKQLASVAVHKVSKTSSGITVGAVINVSHWAKDLSEDALPDLVGLRGGAIRVGDRLHAFLRHSEDASLYEGAFGTFGFRSLAHEWPDFRNPPKGEAYP